MYWSDLISDLSKLIRATTKLIEVCTTFVDNRKFR